VRCVEGRSDSFSLLRCRRNTSRRIGGSKARPHTAAPSHAITTACVTAVCRAAHMRAFSRGAYVCAPLHYSVAPHIRRLLCALCCSMLGLAPVVSRAYAYASCVRVCPSALSQRP
jgi:hypothetical protein